MFWSEDANYKNKTLTLALLRNWVSSPPIKSLHVWFAQLPGKVRLGYCFTPYQQLRLYNGAPLSRLLRHAGDTEDVFSASTPGVPTGVQLLDDTNYRKMNWKI